ncbi:hypothetical protein [Brevifollis gellanilyticus]|uniref:Uncharacterized protein n=1 Tax=Brevifollis gellanilyticus TaxID=748831 RepID=A0A512MF80_9BACT|nr:hypothetical protein [Brevifollis gellanilyticus]GEP45404.1 hypothetical protein BGE01nite_46950 [Brevifollis gellanilyticus]
MSFNDPSFLLNNRRTANEREADKLEWEYRQLQARSYYRWATALVVLTLIYIALPLGLEQWHWHVVIGSGVLITILAIMMMVKGALQNAIISLVFAAVILPGWVKVYPKVLQVAGDQINVIVKEWKRIL